MYVPFSYYLGESFAGRCKGSRWSSDGQKSYLMCPAVAFRKLGRPQASCARLPRALCALMKRLNRPRDAKRSSSSVIMSTKAAGLAPASVRGVAAPLLLPASSLQSADHPVKL